ncbi:MULTISPECIES: hypothetical protein [Rhizobium]|uniref:hypothetical protein n=1 Tax=Rhizobium TaxID=379 RepID=UPI000F4E2EC4|nr:MULTISPECIES: hypothetical protein [Rhizobium]
MATILLKRCTRTLATDNLLNMAKIARKDGFSRPIDESHFKHNQDAALTTPFLSGFVTALPLQGRKQHFRHCRFDAKKGFCLGGFLAYECRAFSSNGAAGGDRPWRRRGNTCRTIHSVTSSA